MSISKNDIFLDRDVHKFLIEIRKCKNPSGVKLIHSKPDENFCLMNFKSSNTASSFYTINITEDFPIQDFKNYLVYLKKEKINIDIRFSIVDFDEKKILDNFREFRVKKIDKKNTLIDVNNFKLSRIRKGMKCNIKKGIKLNVKTDFYFNEDIPMHVLKEFYSCCIKSRNYIGKNFNHSWETFNFRNELTKMGKAVLARSEHENKVNYIWSIISEKNGFYYDAGYNIRINSFTHGYTHYRLFDFLKKIGCNYYSMGLIDQKKEYDMNLSSDRVDFYKKGFKKDLYDVYEIKLKAEEH